MFIVSISLELDLLFRKWSNFSISDSVRSKCNIGIDSYDDRDAILRNTYNLNLIDNRGFHNDAFVEPHNIHNEVEILTNAENEVAQDKGIFFKKIFLAGESTSLLYGHIVP